MFQTYLRQTAALIDQELQQELVFWQNDAEQKAFVEQCSDYAKEAEALTA